MVPDANDNDADPPDSGDHVGQEPGAASQDDQVLVHPSPEHAAPLAASIVAAVRDHFGILLDYSPESLASVDEIILGFRAGGLTEAEVAEPVYKLGCYVGEVFVRNDGGVWVMPDEELAVFFQGMLIELPDNRHCNPIGKAFKLLENGEEDSIVWFYEVFRSFRSDADDRPLDTISARLRAKFGLRTRGRTAGGTCGNMLWSTSRLRRFFAALRIGDG